jgi:glycosyltransferase involved in cell wall biosynthesis
MRVLYLLGFLPPYIRREIDALSSAGIDTTVLLPEKSTGNRPADFWNTISLSQANSTVTVENTLEFKLLTCRAYRLFFPALKSVRFLKSLFLSLRNKEFRYFLIASTAASAIKIKPDIIHAHFALDNAHVARIMAEILNVPYTVTTHATDIFVPRSESRLARVLKKAAAVFTISEYNIDFLMRFGLCRNSITVLKLGLNTLELPERKQPPDIPHAVCTASGLVPKKGIPILMDAMRLLKQKGVDCRLTVIGSDPDGILLEKYREQSTDIPVAFAGLIASGKTLGLVSSASFFVLPCVEAENGDRDGIPVALTEAMGIGIPCISTEISGIPELINSEVSGILVKPGSPGELADAMEKLISQPETAGKLGLEGRRKIISDHSTGRQIGIMLAEFRKILAERRQT